MIPVIVALQVARVRPMLVPVLVKVGTPVIGLTVCDAAKRHCLESEVYHNTRDRAVAGAECNTVIELKQAQHDAFPPLLS